MSEAWAKLHLREHVRSDDIDHAIEMLLESFLASQKVTVATQLKKKFQKYLARHKDSNHLLLHELKNQMQDRAEYQRCLQNVDSATKIYVKLAQSTFQQMARDFAAHDLQVFYNSHMFKQEFRLDGKDIVTINKI